MYQPIVCREDNYESLKLEKRGENLHFKIESADPEFASNSWFGVEATREQVIAVRDELNRRLGEVTR